MRFVPHALSAWRASLALPLAWALGAGEPGVALAAFGLAAVSDVLDGRLARRLGVADRQGRRGPLVDVAADGVFLLAGLTAAWVHAELPAWVPLVAAAMLARFLATSPAGAPRYDPVGRHYGALLYVVLGVWLVDAAAVLRGGVLVVLVVATAASLLGRAWFLRTRAGGAPGAGRRDRRAAGVWPLRRPHASAASVAAAPPPDRG